MTNPAREAAYAAATEAIEQAICDSRVPDPRKLAEAAVDAALASLAGDLYIAPDPNLPPGFGGVWAPGEEGCRAHELHVRADVWALLEAVLPSKEGTS